MAHTLLFVAYVYNFDSDPDNRPKDYSMCGCTIMLPDPLSFDKRIYVSADTHYITNGG